MKTLLLTGGRIIDPANQFDAVADLLLSLHQEEKTALVVVTHSPSLAARFDRRYELVDQRLRPLLPPLS